jgi:hypothetical protein
VTGIRTIIRKVLKEYESPSDENRFGLIGSYGVYTLGGKERRFYFGERVVTDKSISELAAGKMLEDGTLYGAETAGESPNLWKVLKKDMAFDNEGFEKAEGIIWNNFHKEEVKQFGMVAVKSRYGEWLIYHPGKKGKMIKIGTLRRDGSISILRYPENTRMGVESSYEIPENQFLKFNDPGQAMMYVYLKLGKYARKALKENDNSGMPKVELGLGYKLGYFFPEIMNTAVIRTKTGKLWFFMNAIKTIKSPANFDGVWEPKRGRLYYYKEGSYDATYSGYESEKIPPSKNDVKRMAAIVAMKKVKPINRNDL